MVGNGSRCSDPSLFHLGWYFQITARWTVAERVVCQPGQLVVRALRHSVDLCEELIWRQCSRVHYALHGQFDAGQVDFHQTLSGLPKRVKNREFDCHDFRKQSATISSMEYIEQARSD